MECEVYVEVEHKCQACPRPAVAFFVGQCSWGAPMCLHHITKSRTEELVIVRHLKYGRTYPSNCEPVSLTGKPIQFEGVIQPKTVALLSDWHAAMSEYPEARLKGRERLLTALKDDPDFSAVAEVIRWLANPKEIVNRYTEALNHIAHCARHGQDDTLADRFEEIENWARRGLGCQGATKPEETP